MIPILDLIKQTVPEGSGFLKPMSKNARILLSSMLIWVNEASMKFGGFKPMIKILISVYDPIIYEEACHKFDMSKYINKLPSVKKCKTKEEIVKYFTLQNLKDDMWLMESGISYNPNKVGLISEQAPADLYKWLVDNYLLIDFTEHDLNKISQMGQQQFDVSIIKQEALSIVDPDKRNISYLYAIVVNKALTSRASKEKQSVEDDANRAKLARILALDKEAQTKTPYSRGTALAGAWRRAREYLDILKDKYNE